MADQAPIRVALLNDYPLVVEGLATMLRPYRDRVEVVDARVEGGIDAPVDVALYDTFATDADDAHWSQHVRNGRVPRYVVLYSWETPPLPEGGFAEGVPTTLQVPKTLDGAALVDAIEQIHATGSYEQPSPAAHDATGSSAHRRWPGRDVGLTERESEILALIVTGVSNQEIAERLFLGVNTIKTYIRSAYRTMGVTDRPNAILWGIDHGFRRQRPPA